MFVHTANIELSSKSPKIEYIEVFYHFVTVILIKKIDLKTYEMLKITDLIN